MNRRPPITLEEVGTAIEKLRADDEKVTVRNIHRLTGGSNSTIIEFKKSLLEQEKAGEVRPDAVSDFLNVVLKGGDRLVDAAIKEVKQQLEAAQELYDDALSVIIALEEEKAVTAEEHEFAVAELTSKNRSLEKEKIMVEHKHNECKLLIVEEQKNRCSLEKKFHRLLNKYNREKGRAEGFESQIKGLLSGEALETVTCKSQGTVVSTTSSN
jgi:predicted RND superfamily exporter protein